MHTHKGGTRRVSQWSMQVVRAPQAKCRQEAMRSHKHFVRIIEGGGRGGRRHGVGCLCVTSRTTKQLEQSHHRQNPSGLTSHRVGADVCRLANHLRYKVVELVAPTVDSTGQDRLGTRETASREEGNMLSRAADRLGLRLDWQLD